MCFMWCFPVLVSVLLFVIQLNMKQGTPDGDMVPDYPYLNSYICAIELKEVK
jgi:hypothetical protein